MRPSRPVTIVITGASSGIGRATAEAFARRGVRLVLAARGEAALREVAHVCAAHGADTLMVPTDVGDAEAVAALARLAADTGDGRIDVWINNAGVGTVGLLEQTPVHAHERVLRTNLIAYLYGAHAVLPYFKREGHGTLINVLSMNAWSPSAYGVSYTASKYGLRGFSEALRAELLPFPGIHVCDIFPAVADTPAFRHCANYTGKAIRPPRPLVDPRAIARAIVRAAARPHRQATTIGSVAWLSRVGNLVTPGLTRRFSQQLAQRYLDRADPAPRTDGNLFDPTEGYMAVDGGWRNRNEGSRATQAGLIGAGLLALGVSLGILARRRRQAD
ncbi:SDR family oxidoreductase [Cupriavidus cauae]|uniref:SDR family oxidoreductase n=1 Tax=Cupriavidus TaxID=106589 RepID=UPI001CF54E76|nr:MULTISPECIES: SDR family oxidoreductase [Cupriavidus]MCA7082267.1 SDR family oxidoreductase [Cupriavidus sp. DB3]UZN51762.1 SDR family oxidoreductase [Cupriavidus cauae]